MKFHPLCDIFPEMPDDEFERFVARIKETGYIEPVIVHEGMILDGKHRWRACQRLRIDCPTKAWTGECGTADNFVMVKNADRRHISPSQRAIVAARRAKYLDELEKPKNPLGAIKNVRQVAQTTSSVGKSKPPPSAPPTRKNLVKAANELEVPLRSAQRAATVDQVPGKGAEVLSGKKPLGVAEREIKEQKQDLSGAPVDGLGRPVLLDLLWPIFGDKEIDGIQNMLATAKSRIKKLADSPVCAGLHLQSIEKALADCWEALKNGKPYTQCPMCRHPFQKGCSACKDRRWITKIVYDSSIPPEFKQQQDRAYRTAGAVPAGSRA